MGSLRILVRNRGLARCEAVWALSALGGWAFSIIFGLYAYYEHGPGGVAVAVAARMLPAALIMRAGAPAMLRRRVGSARASLLVSTLGRFVMLEAVAVVVSFEGPFGVLLALAAGFETAGAAHRSARSQMLTELAQTPTELAVANASRVATSAGLLAGSVAAGILVAVTGMDTAFALSGLAFLSAAAVAWSLPSVLASVDERLPLVHGVRVLRAVARNRFARIRIGWFSATTFVDSALDLLLVITALDLLGIGGGGVGWLRAAFAAGGLLGGMAAWTALRSGRLALALGIGAALAGIPLALIAAWPALAPAAVFIALLGGGFALVEGTLSLLTGRLASGGIPAEIVGLEELIYPFARAIGAGVSAWCVVAFGDDASLVVFGLVLPVIGLIGLWPMWRAERRVAVPHETFELLRGALPDLPTTLIEDLALVSEEVRLRPGETVPDDGSLYVVPREGEGERRAVVVPRDALLACAAGRPVPSAPRPERSFEYSQSALSSVRSETPQPAASSRQAAR